MIGADEVRARFTAGGERYPLLTVEEFFRGNDAEESIAPNQYGFGRPELAEIGSRLWSFAEDPAVAWTRVQPHEEMFWSESGELSAEGVTMCTALAEEQVDARLDVELLMSEGVFEGLAYPLEDFCGMPEVPAGHRVLSLVWD
ncbi:hypothetical protein JGS22_001845 [Streptomyces sp. P38-E01]|uniref:Uncharacterized protein n=1 Tax=Streptomyces tardus TaxID=2780544 RepID=A0A949JDH0_9ACTN|nr:hypothetical protein [Streptomyces tardus]MBU7596414.1 hypothetical protein [Streptomyces tardus]